MGKRNTKNMLDALGDYVPAWLAKSDAALEGNRQGRAPIYSDPHEVLDAAMQYLSWAEANPLWEEKAFVIKGELQKIKLNKMRITTISGLQYFMQISKDAWAELKKQSDAMRAACEAAEAAIRDNTLSGGGAELLNPGIVAKVLGLAEKQEHTISVPPSITVQYD